MKHLFIALMGTLGLFLADGQEKNDLQKQNLKGNVKSVKYITIQDDAINEYPLPYIDRQVFYNQQGNMIEKTSDNDTRKASYTYHKNSRQRKEAYLQHKNEPPHKKYTYQYDHLGNEIIREEFDIIDNKPLTKQTFLYDNQGNVVEERLYYCYRYEEPVTMKIVTEKSTTSHNHHKNDNQQNPPNYLCDKMDNKTLYKYNEKNLLIEEFNYSKDNIIQKWNYTYDEEGNTQEIISYLDNVMWYHISYSYEFDNHRNWNKRMTYENGRVISVTERIIEYY